MIVTINDYTGGFSILIRNDEGAIDSLHCFDEEEGPIGLVDVFECLGIETEYRSKEETEGDRE